MTLLAWRKKGPFVAQGLLNLSRFEFFDFYILRLLCLNISYEGGGVNRDSRDEVGCDRRAD